MRVLIDDLSGRPAGEIEAAELGEFYRPPSLPWLRVNMVTTLDGAAAGESGVSDSINNAADKAVFHALRSQCDALIVGAGTARAEGYRPARMPIVVVSRSAEIPATLAGANPGSVLMATCASAPGMESARAALGGEQVIVAGADAVDLTALRQALLARGFAHLLCEGGPGLLRDLLAADLVDELALTTVPLAVAGGQSRIVGGAAIEADFSLASLLESEGTLLARYLRRR